MHNLKSDYSAKSRISLYNERTSGAGTEPCQARSERIRVGACPEDMDTS